MPQSEGLSFWRELQTQVGVWSQHNFGDQLAHRPAMGMVEELTELSAAIDARDRSETLDAIADTIIYMADYHYRRGWLLSETWNKRFPVGNPVTAILFVIGKLCHSHLKGEQNIRGGSDEHDSKMRTAMSGTLGYLEQLCKFLDVDLISIVRGVWSVVGLRDWKKNPNDANAVAVVAAAEGKVGYMEAGPTLSTVSVSVPSEVLAAARDLDPITIPSPPPVEYEVGDEVHE